MSRDGSHQPESYGIAENPAHGVVYALGDVHRTALFDAPDDTYQVDRLQAGNRSRTYH
jgi:hypothetical protein